MIFCLSHAAVTVGSFLSAFLFLPLCHSSAQTVAWSPAGIFVLLFGEERLERSRGVCATCRAMAAAVRGQRCAETQVCAGCHQHRATSGTPTLLQRGSAKELLFGAFPLLLWGEMRALCAVFGRKTKLTCFSICLLSSVMALLILD